MALMHKETFKIVRRPETNGYIPLEEYVEVDDMIATVISILNKKGYATLFCCSGHNVAIGSTTYICFKADCLPDILPEGFVLEDDDYYSLHFPNHIRSKDKITIRKKYNDGRCDEKLKEIIDTMIELGRWVEKLPYLQDKLRGNNILCKDDVWYFEETGDLVKDNFENMPCGHCGRKFTEEGHDGCLGTLIGVMNACCGHGRDNEAYIQFLDGSCVRGNDAKIIMSILKRYSEDKENNVSVSRVIFVGDHGYDYEAYSFEETEMSLGDLAHSIEVNDGDYEDYMNMFGATFVNFEANLTQKDVEKLNRFINTSERKFYYLP